MGTFRLYTGPDGQGRIETINIEKKDDWLKGLPTTQISFSVWPVGRFIDWHPAPRRQFVVTLSGESEVELEGGRRIRLGPGHILLAEDTTGQGHISRAVGSGERISLFIPLAEGATAPR